MQLVKNLPYSKIVKYAFLALTGTVILSISAKFKIPVYPVPMTMQTFVVLFIGVAFGWKLGVTTILLYLFEGIIGLPVFAGTPEKGIGLIYFFGPTMGYLIGFIPAVFFAGLFKVDYKLNLLNKLLANFIFYTFAVSFIYLFGLIWLVKFVPVEKVWEIGAMPFLLAELFKISILAFLTAIFGKSILSWRSLR